METALREALQEHEAALGTSKPDAQAVQRKIKLEKAQRLMKMQVLKPLNRVQLLGPKPW